MTEGEKANLKSFMAPARRRVAEAAKCSVAQACAEPRSSLCWDNRQLVGPTALVLPAEQCVSERFCAFVTGG